MRRAGWMVVLGLVAAGIGCSGETLAQGAGACGDGSPPTDSRMDLDSKVATAQHPARIVPVSGPSLLSRSPALRLTLRPTAAAPDASFLVQVLMTDRCGAQEKRKAQTLGVVSFFPLRLGRPQEFVLPAPQQGFPALSPQHVELTIKLIPPQPDGRLEETSVEVVDAQFAE
jgi:hypothetical protein